MIGSFSSRSQKWGGSLQLIIGRSESSEPMAMTAPPCRKTAAVGSLRFWFTRFFFALALNLPGAHAAPEAAPEAKPSAVFISAAANLVYVLDALNVAFAAHAPHLTLNVATGASGSLVAQIRHGAPCDIFLSADLDYPRALIASGQAEPKTLFTFATGRLVLWTTRPGLHPDSLATLVRDPAVRRIALAQPDTAPYGRAAKQALEHLGEWTRVQPKLVFGESITQTAQFVETGNADAGFVALSLIRSPRLQQRGAWLLVPEDWHESLAQGAVLTRRGATHPAAVRYLEFLRSVEAQKILERFGYAVPTVTASEPQSAKDDVAREGTSPRETRP